MGSEPIPITSLTNARIKDLVRLRQRGHRSGRGLMIVEEPLVIGRGLDTGIACREVYFCPDNMGAQHTPLLEKLLKIPGVDAYELAAPVMAKVAYRDRPQGLLVVADRPQARLEDLVLPAESPALLLVLEGVEKPGNLGAVQRVADGAGAHGIIVCGDGVDPWNPNVLRASRGACFSTPTVTAPAAQILTWLKERGIAAVATSPAGAMPYDRFDLTAPVALILGTEHDGLSPNLLDAADCTVAIPMHGSGDSLNVSTSAAILLYEAARQRATARKAP
ncbi:RNA methyltransferase [bacterium CG17_big_fil_post_rev_8_21_14_2_50_64_8]|nr:MAG: RNA methyltransferase [bacterium CG17_big_fil_post_rev_8_21_14_2_50_64_8]PJA76504.1 MAG: RNA methyltransferase [bacterium CG_4_9_14_3_um_filter_65_15]